jgi:hypothetical protein
VKRRQQFSLTILFLATLVFSVVFAVVRYNLPLQRYRRNGDEASLYKVLSTNVSRSDSQESVTALLGRGTTDDELLSALLKWQAGPHYDANVWPDGIQEDDVLLEFDAKPYNVRLQFRNGRLVNFDPTEFDGGGNILSGISAN